MKIIMPARLTAENGAKSLMIGEFSSKVKVVCPCCNGGGTDYDGNDCLVCDDHGMFEMDVPVSWTTIKDIYRKLVVHFGELES